jgi:hypothetical protein
MQVDYPGSIVPFPKVPRGAFFAHFAGGTLGLAMKIHLATVPPTNAVLSFSNRLQPTIPAPMVLDTARFDNRDVLVFTEARLRPSSDLKAIADGSPSLEERSVGTVILVGGSLLIRAVYRMNFWDINLATGDAEKATTHPGSMWIDDWEIVLLRPGGDMVLCRRDKPAT